MFFMYTQLQQHKHNKTLPLFLKKLLTFVEDQVLPGAILLDLLLSSFVKYYEHWGSERLGKLPKVTQLV